MMSKARLELGRILATPGALECWRKLGSTTAVAEATRLRGLGRGGLPNTWRPAGTYSGSPRYAPR